MAMSGNSEPTYKFTSEIKVEEKKMDTIMKQSNIWILITGTLLLLVISAACQRSVDGLDEPGFTTNPDVFINDFSPGLNYLPFEGSRAEAFSVDNETTFGRSTLSMRFDVPNVGDPEGAFAGAIFRDENGGRDLRSYNALTFYAKGTKAGTVNEIGFGQDFFGGEYLVTLEGMRLTTNWRKYIIPIPDASNLRAEQGLLWYAEGPEDGDGYTFWLDEVRFENISDLAQPRPAILNGNDETITGFPGTTTTVDGLIFTANQPNGQDVTVLAAPAYYTFSSSNTSVATVNEMGEVSIVGNGTTEITAQMGDLDAAGSLTIQTVGDLDPPPTPTEDPADVISIFSNTFEDVPVDFYNGFYEPFQTTTSNDFELDGNQILGYENFNFVGIEFNQNVPTIDGSEMTHLRMDVYFPEEIPSGSALRVRLVNNLGGDESVASITLRPSTTPALESGQWISIDMDITGMADRSNLGQIILDSDEGPALQGASFFVGNIYLRR